MTNINSPHSTQLPETDEPESLQGLRFVAYSDTLLEQFGGHFKAGFAILVVLTQQVSKSIPLQGRLV